MRSAASSGQPPALGAVLAGMLQVDARLRGKPRRRRSARAKAARAAPACAPTPLAPSGPFGVIVPRGPGVVVLAGQYKPGPVTYLAPTPRMVEVMAMPRTMATLRQLVMEKPRGACAVCWRDQHHDSLANDLLACSRTVRGTAQCSAFISQVRGYFRRRAERAKASLLAELEVAHVG